MKTIKFILIIIAVAAVINVQAIGVSSQNCIIQVRNLSEKIESVEKKQALEQICRYYSESNFTKEMLQEYTNLIVQAQNNVQSIAYSAELSSKVKNHADVFIGIARTAANTNFEASFYLDVLDLALLKCIESDIVKTNHMKVSDLNKCKQTENKIKEEITGNKDGK